MGRTKVAKKKMEGTTFSLSEACSELHFIGISSSRPGEAPTQLQFPWETLEVFYWWNVIFVSAVLSDLQPCVSLLSSTFLQLSVRKSNTEDLLLLLATDQFLFNLHPMMFLVRTEAVAMTTVTISVEGKKKKCPQSSKLSAIELIPVVSHVAELLIISFFNVISTKFLIRLINSLIRSGWKMGGGIKRGIQNLKSEWNVSIVWTTPSTLQQDVCH